MKRHFLVFCVSISPVKLGESVLRAMYTLGLD